MVVFGRSLAAHEQRLAVVLRKQAWSIACSEASWEVALCEDLREVLSDDESVHVVRFRSEDTGKLRVGTWIDSPTSPPELAGRRDQVLDEPRRHPGVNAMIARGTTSPIRLSDVVDLPRFRQTEVFQRMHVYPIGTRFASGAVLMNTSRELVLLGAHSTKKDLSDDHMEALVRIQRVLAPALALRHELGRSAATNGEPSDRLDVDRVMGPHGQPLRLLLPMRQTEGDYLPTRREQQVLGLLTLGLTSRQIARHLEITERTVRKHLESIYRKANLPSRAAAASWWLRRSGG